MLGWALRRVAVPAGPPAEPHRRPELLAPYRAFGARLGGAARVERRDQPGYPATAPTFKMRDHSAVFRPTSPSIWSVRGGSVHEILDEELHFIVDNPLDGVGEHMGRITQLVIELDVEHRGGHFPFDTVEHLIDRRR